MAYLSQVAKVGRHLSQDQNLHYLSGKLAGIIIFSSVRKKLCHIRAKDSTGEAEMGLEFFSHLKAICIISIAGKNKGTLFFLSQDFWDVGAPWV